MMASDDYHPYRTASTQVTARLDGTLYTVTIAKTNGQVTATVATGSNRDETVILDFSVRQPLDEIVLGFSFASRSLPRLGKPRHFDVALARSRHERAATPAPAYEPPRRKRSGRACGASGRARVLL